MNKEKLQVIISPPSKKELEFAHKYHNKNRLEISQALRFYDIKPAFKHLYEVQQHALYYRDLSQEVTFDEKDWLGGIFYNKASYEYNKKEVCIIGNVEDRLVVGIEYDMALEAQSDIFSNQISYNNIYINPIAPIIITLLDLGVEVPKTVVPSLWISIANSQAETDISEDAFEVGKIFVKAKERGPILAKAVNLLLEKKKEIQDCPNCFGKYVLKKSNRTSFWACNRYPYCKKIDEDRFDDIQGEKAGKGDEVCPTCGAKMNICTVKHGPRKGIQFWGCSAFPKCKTTKNYNPHLINWGKIK